MAGWLVRSAYSSVVVGSETEGSSDLSEFESEGSWGGPPSWSNIPDSLHIGYDSWSY